MHEHTHIKLVYMYICVSADPAVPGLVYSVKDTGQAGTERFKVEYCRGTNANETVNRPLEDVMPPICGAPHFHTLFWFYVTAYNLRQGHNRLGLPKIGCYDILLLDKVISDML